MKIVEIECRKIDEWDEETQKVIIDKHRDINTNYDWWDADYEYFTEQLEEQGWSNIRIRFSGFWSQGDGASFTGELDVLQWLKFTNKPEYRRLIPLIENGWIDVSRAKTISRYCGNYVHEKSVTFDLQWSYSCSYKESDKYNNIDKLLSELEDDIENHRYDMCRQIYQDLQNEYEGATSDESIKETLSINEYEFDKEGRIW